MPLEAFETIKQNRPFLFSAFVDPEEVELLSQLKTQAPTGHGSD